MAQPRLDVVEHQDSHNGPGIHYGQRPVSRADHLVPCALAEIVGGRGGRRLSVRDIGDGAAGFGGLEGGPVGPGHSTGRRGSPPAAATTSQPRWWRCERR